MRLFYTADIERDLFTFDKNESHHIVKVLRLNHTDKILITDGKGWFYHCEIVEAHPKKCLVKVLDKEQIKKHNYHLHVAIAPTKNIDRFEWFLEKATEIGVDEITPIITHYSERKIIKHERLKKVIESAMKQSHKAYHPRLNELVTLADFWKKQHPESVKLIAHCYESEKENMQQQISPKDSVLMLIGPEGDFSEEEVKQSEQIGFVPVSLGNYRLRTETAGVVACNYLSFINS